MAMGIRQLPHVLADAVHRRFEPVAHGLSLAQTKPMWDRCCLFAQPDQLKCLPCNRMHFDAARRCEHGMFHASLAYRLSTIFRWN